MKKQILLLIIIFFLANVNAYETNVQISTIDETVPVTGSGAGDGFYHWITLDWEYTGPTGENDWRTCDFESVDKNYGIFLDLSGTGFPTVALIEDFGPTTSTPECNPQGKPPLSKRLHPEWSE